MTTLQSAKPQCECGGMLGSAPDLYLSVHDVFMPPAHPINSSPSSSESRFIRILDSKKPLSSPLAPFNPVSSSMVKRHSRGPCLSSGSARGYPAAMPLSAPSVVSCFYPLPIHKYFDRICLKIMKAVAVLFANHVEMALKTYWLPVFMAAGLRISTLPVGSFSKLSLWFLANSVTYAIIFSSCLEGLGILVISSKYIQEDGFRFPSLVISGK